ncbi:hypothetical protein QVD99_000978 [Batrachochytrium dendrobatidis]|nr:hypothetical protein QVD99_000978 [Batrachochytrium dendrobatidis]
MLITLQYFLTVMQMVAAIKVRLHSSDTSGESSNRLSKRSPVQLQGDISSCYRMKFNIAGVDLDLKVDSRISDSIVPLPNLNNYQGPTLSYPEHADAVTLKYDGGASAKGHGFLTTVSIPETTISIKSAPVVGISEQSENPVIIDGNPNQGVFSFAYPSIAMYHAKPPTIMDAIYESGAVPNNEVAMELCPYGLSEKSYIDIGNTETDPKCDTDGQPVIWVQSPSRDRFTVNIKEIRIDNKARGLPSEFQVKESEDIWHPYSFISTCSKYISLPRKIVDKLIRAIGKSGAFKPKLTKDDIKKFFEKKQIIKVPDHIIDWKKLPKLSFVMYTETSKTGKASRSSVEITLGGRDYIQQVGAGEYQFFVDVGRNKRVVLGTPFMLRMRVVFDRTNQRIGFGPGCGCENSADGYPIISSNSQVLWSPRPKKSSFRQSSYRKLSKS